MSVTPEDPVATPIGNHAEVLNRQVPEAMIDSRGDIMKGAFTPSALDQGLLSTLRGHVEPDEAWRRWTGTSSSAGTWGVAVGEAIDEGLTCLDDGQVDGNPPDHASIDFSSKTSNGKRAQTGRKLRDHATNRGPLFQP